MKQCCSVHQVAQQLLYLLRYASQEFCVRKKKENDEFQLFDGLFLSSWIPFWGNKQKVEVHMRLIEVLQSVDSLVQAIARHL